MKRSHVMTRLGSQNNSVPYRPKNEKNVAKGRLWIGVRDKTSGKRRPRKGVCEKAFVQRRSCIGIREKMPTKRRLRKAAATKRYPRKAAPTPRPSIRGDNTRWQTLDFYFFFTPPDLNPANPNDAPLPDNPSGDNPPCQGTPRTTSWHSYSLTTKLHRRRADTKQN